MILSATTTTPLACLLIDGDPPAAVAISRALAGAGMRIVGTATSAARGLELLETHQADVAVVDRQLPDMDGIDLAVAISRSPSPARTLLCAGDADPALAGQALAAGINGLITSGSPAAEVVRAVRAVAAGGTYVDPRLGGPLALREGLPVLAERDELLLQYLADGLSRRADRPRAPARASCRQRRCPPGRHRHGNEKPRTRRRSGAEDRPDRLTAHDRSEWRGRRDGRRSGSDAAVSGRLPGADSADPAGGPATAGRAVGV